MVASINSCQWKGLGCPNRHHQFVDLSAACRCLAFLHNNWQKAKARVAKSHSDCKASYCGCDFGSKRSGSRLHSWKIGGNGLHCLECPSASLWQENGDEHCWMRFAVMGKPQIGSRYTKPEILVQLYCLLSGNFATYSNIKSSFFQTLDIIWKRSIMAELQALHMCVHSAVKNYSFAIVKGAYTWYSASS